MKINESKSINQTHTKPTFKTSESLFGENSEMKQALEKEQKVVRTMLGLEQQKFSNIKLRKKDSYPDAKNKDNMISHRQHSFIPSKPISENLEESDSFSSQSMDSPKGKSMKMSFNTGQYKYTSNVPQPVIDPRAKKHIAMI